MPVLLPAATPSQLPFPDGDLECTVEFAPGADLEAGPTAWAWTDLSSRLLNTPVTIKRGPQTTTATLHLLNLDGWLTPHLATSGWWPYVDAGTPIRLRIRTEPDQTDTFERTETGAWGTSDDGITWTPNSAPTIYSVTGGQGLITLPTTSVTRTINSDVSRRDVDILFDAALNAVPTGAQNWTGPTIRRDAGGTTQVFTAIEWETDGAVVLRVRTRVASVDTLIASATIPALTYTPGTMLRSRVQVIGGAVRMRTWLAAGVEPSTWHIDITQTAVSGTGLVGFSTSVLSSNPLPIVFTFDNVTIAQPYYDRLEGYITDVRPEFLPQPDGTTWSTVLVDVGGIGSLAEKREAPAFSPMRRSIQLSVSPFTTAPPRAYWPLEDPEGSLSAASAFPGQRPMTVTGPAVFGFAQGVPEDLYQSTYGTKPLVSVAAGARLSAPVPISSVTTEWAVDVTAQLYVPDVPAVTEIRVAEWSTPSGTVTRWAVVATSTGYQVRAYNDLAGTSTNVITTVGAGSRQYVFEIDAVQNAGNIDVNLFLNSGPIGSGSVAGTMGAVSYVAVNPDRANTTASLTPAGLRFIVGHVRVSDDTDGSGVPFYLDADRSNMVLRANTAWYQEAAHRRVERLLAEGRTPCTILGDPYTTGGITVLNAQRAGTGTELVGQAVESESGGVLFERGFGYHYLPRTARYNRLPALTVDMATYRRSQRTDQADILVPALESRAANYWTVSRYLGSSGSAAADETYRQRRGTIPEERTLDVLTDDVLDDHAAWRVHTGTGGRDAHYPSIPLDLAANPDYIDDWLYTDIGSRVWRINQPTVAGHNTIDQVVDGITETIGPRTWSTEMQASPGAVWDVWEPGDPVLGWLNPSGCTLQTAVGSSTSTLIIATVGAAWTTSSGAYPVDVELAGEQVTLPSPPGGSTSPQTFTGVVRAVNGVAKTHPAGRPVTLWTQPVVGL